MAEANDPKSRRWLPSASHVFVALFAALVVHALAATYVFTSLWDFRVFQTAWYDHAWQLELGWRAHLGQWSGRDFHYPRGPLWQLVAYLSWRPWRGSDATAADALGGIVGAFRLLALATVAWMAWARVRQAALRPVILLILASLSFGAGVPTFRALLSLVIVLVLLPPRDDASRRFPIPRWRNAVLAAGLATLALLSSFDRFGVAMLSVAAVFGIELAVTRREGASMRAPALRLAHFIAALSAALLLVAAVGWMLGADPLAYVAEQRALAAGYASGMRTPWHVGVPPVNVAGLFAAGVALVGAAWWRRAPGHVLGWLAGALPPALFGLVTSDQGHIYMALLPFLCVLVLAAAERGVDGWSRFGAGLLAAITILGWFGTYPASVSIDPRVFRDAIAVARGEKRPDRGFVSEHARAVTWARERVAEENPRCVAFWPSLTVAHAMARVPGPTMLALRWNDTQQRALSRAIAEHDCPLYLHDILSFDDIGGSWFLGPDFLTIVERYRFEERVGVGLAAMRRRDEPIEIDAVPLPTPRRAAELALPGELVVPLGRTVEGTSVVRLDYTLELDGLRAQLGGLPWAEWRFEREGAPVGDWQTLHHLRAGEGTVYLSPDPEAVEWSWIAETPLVRRVRADALRIRFERRGVFTPDALTFVVRAMTEHPSPAPGPEPAVSCRAEIDLLEQLRAGQAFTRMVSPRPALVHFHLDPNVYPFPDAEIFFRARPCADACLHMRAGVVSDVGDGVDLELHVLWREERLRVLSHRVSPGTEIPFEIPLDRWAGRSILLRLGTRNGRNVDGDHAVIVEPRIGPCSARRWVAEAVESGDARVARGTTQVRGRDVYLGASGAELRYPLHVLDHTCFGVGYASEGVPFRARVRVGLMVDGLEHVLFERDRELSQTPVGESHSLGEYAGRDAELVVATEPLEGDGEPSRWTGPHVYECAP